MKLLGLCSAVFLMWSCIVSQPTIPASVAIESSTSSPENVNRAEVIKTLTEDEARSIAGKYFGEIVQGGEDRGEYWFICPLTSLFRQWCEETGIYIQKTTGAILPRLSRQEAETISRKHYKLPERADLFIETRGNYFFAAPRFTTLFNSENGIYIHKQTSKVLTSRPASLDPP